VYVRPFAPPTGARLLALAANGRFDAALRLAHEAVRRAAAAEPGRLCVFDRHWMTVLSLVPEERWGEWRTLPPTVLCWADIGTTLTRLRERGDSQSDEDVQEHLHYLDRYAALAKRFGCPVLRTDELSADAALDWLLGWAGAVRARSSRHPPESRRP
jgi:hypothetical protein